MKMASASKYQNKLVQEKAEQLTFGQIIQEITIAESELTECKAQKDFNREVLKNKMENSEDPAILRSEKVDEGVTLKQMTMDINEYNVSYGDYKRVNFNKDIVLDTAKVVETLIQRNIDRIEATDPSVYDNLSGTAVKEAILEAIRADKNHVTTVVNSFESATTTTVYDRLDIGYNKKKAPR
jgi:hypothetical protein